MNWNDLRRKILPRVFKGTIIGIEYKCEGPLLQPKERLSYLHISIRSKKDPNVVLRYPMGRIEFLRYIHRKGLATGDSITIFSRPFSSCYHLLRLRRKAEMSPDDKKNIVCLLDKAVCELEHLIDEKKHHRPCPYSVRQLEHYQTEAVISKIHYR